MDPAEVDYKTSLMRSFHRVRNELEQYHQARNELLKEREEQMADVNAIDNLDRDPPPPATLTRYYMAVQNLNRQITKLDLQHKENEAIEQTILQEMLSEDVLVVKDENDVDVLNSLRQVHGWHGKGFARPDAAVEELRQLMHTLGVDVME